MNTNEKAVSDRAMRRADMIIRELKSVPPGEAMLALGFSMAAIVHCAWPSTARGQIVDAQCETIKVAVQLMSEAGIPSMAEQH